METIWILLADQNRLRVFEILEKIGTVREVVDFLSPRGRMRIPLACEITNEDAKEPIDPQEASKGAEAEITPRDDELFSKQICNFMENARRRGRFTKLRIVAPCEFLEILCKSMSKGVKQSIEGEIVHSLFTNGTADVEEFLRSLNFTPMKSARPGNQSAYQTNSGASL